MNSDVEYGFCRLIVISIEQIALQIRSGISALCLCKRKLLGTTVYLEPMELTTQHRRESVIYIVYLVEHPPLQPQLLLLLPPSLQQYHTISKTCIIPSFSISLFFHCSSLFLTVSHLFRSRRLTDKTS